MLFVFYGSDRLGVRTEANKLKESFLREEPPPVFSRLDADSWDKEKAKALLRAQSLFAPKLLVFFDYCGEISGAVEEIFELSPALSSANNVFILLEKELPPAFLLFCEEKNIEARHCELKTEKEGSKISRGGFNVYVLADALAGRDRRRLWALFHEALAAGWAPEEIFFKCVWQIKNLLLAKKAPKEMEALGVHRFVAGKARRAAEKWSAGELEKFSADLVILYHQARRGALELPLALERLFLSV